MSRKQFAVRVLMLARRYADAMSCGSGGHVATQIGCFRVELSGTGLDAHMSVWRTGRADGAPDVRMFDIRCVDAIHKSAGVCVKFTKADVIPLFDDVSHQMVEALLIRFILIESEMPRLIRL